PSPYTTLFRSRAIDCRGIFLIAGMLPLGTAMADTGAARFLAEIATDLFGSLGPWWVIGALYIVTALANLVIPAAALVVVMSPIVLTASAELGVEPHTAMMAIAMAASASFSSPVSHAAHVLVMGPGGYRVNDFLRVGLPLTLVPFVTAMLVLPIFWPLTKLSS